MIRCDKYGENVAVGGQASGSDVVDGKTWDRSIDQISTQANSGGT